MAKRICLIFILLLSSLGALNLKEKIHEGKNGDFIVAQVRKHTSVLFIRSVTPSLLSLEEVTVPSSVVSSSQFDWQGWIKKGAPGNTSWILYTINLENNKLKSSYSFSRKGWLAVEEGASFLTQLLSLPLTPASSSERRRIGPPPAPGMEDRRALWNPPVIMQGKKIDKPALTVFKTIWPKDETELSQCEIFLYFDASKTDFPFPHWIEIKSPHYAQNIRILDAGPGLTSYYP